MRNIDLLECELLTCSNTLQFLSQPEALQVKLRTFMANFCKFGVPEPYALHQSAGIMTS